MGSHTYADQIAWIYNVWITALQVNRLHGIHVVDVDSSVNRIISMSHIKSIISKNDLVAYGLPLATSVETLIQPAIASKCALAHTLLDSEISVSIEVVLEREERLSRPQAHLGSPS